MANRNDFSLSGQNEAAQHFPAPPCEASGQMLGGYQTDSVNSAKRERDPLKDAMQLVEADKHHRSLQADQILMLRAVMPAISSGLRTLASGIYQWCSHQGFWNVGEQGSLISYEQTKMKKAEKIALIHSEVSEMLEAVRNGDDLNEGEEAADIAIRLLDYCGRYNIDLGAAIEQKMLRNYQRPYKHGKGF